MRYQRIIIANADFSYVGISCWDVVTQNDLPTIFNNSVKSVLFADDTSLVTSSDKYTYRNEVNSSFAHLNAWFNSNLLTLNFNKLVQSVTKFSSNI
jgi:hypothetical protein